MQRWHLVLLAVIGWLAPGQGWADDKKKPVEIEIWAIRATTKNDKISPELKELAASLKKELKFTGFTLEKKVPGKTEMNKAFAGDLIAGFKVTVTPTERSEKDGKIQLKVVVTSGKGKEEKKHLNTTVTVSTGKLATIGGCPLDDGDRLIIAVRAR